MALFTTATPMHYALGTDDQSTRRILPTIKGEIQHVPFFPLLTPRGDYKRHHVTGGELLAIYGDEALDPTSPFSNHHSIFASTVLATGTTCVVQRLRPKVDVGLGTERDAGIATVTFYTMEKTTTTTTKPYLRDPLTGKVIRDIAGEAQLDTAAADIEITEVSIVAKKNEDIATAIQQTVTLDGADYQMTPIFTAPAEGHGVSYNDIGLALSPMVGDNTDTEVLSKADALKYQLKVVDKSTGRNVTVKTVSADDAVSFVFKPYTTDPVTNKGITFEDVFPKSYGNMTDPDLPFTSMIFDGVVLHDEVAFKNVLAGLLEKEITGDTGAINSWADYSDNTPANIATVASKEAYLFNFLTLLSSEEVEYEMIRPVVVTPTLLTDLDTQGFKFVTPNEDVPTFLMGGEDGDIENLDHYESLVANEIAKYADPDSEVISTALNKETIFYDTGFKYRTKALLGKFISIRRDNMLILSTYEWNRDNNEQSISDALSYAASLKAIVQLYPESKAFGTPTARAAIIMGSGIKSDGTYRYRMPLALDYAVKAARFMGAGNGRWNSVYEFSRQPQNIVEELIDISPKFIPDSIKVKLWKAGLIWVESEDTATYFYPGQQTVYENDTSVLNTVVTAVAIGTIARVNDAAWRKFSGVNTMSNIDLKMAVEAFVSAKLKDKFNSQYVIVPEVIITEADEVRGYSWHLVVKIYANNMKTVMESHIVALRMSDLTA